MTTEKNAPTLEEIAIHALEELKGLDIVSLDVRKLTSITNTMLICCGTSERHCRSLAGKVVEEAKTHGFKPLSENYEGGWMLVDLGDVIVHVMLREVRDFYNLEKLWAKDAAE